MKFLSPKECFDYIQNCNDIWSPELGIYVFLYSESGSICYYKIDYDEAKELEKMSQDSEASEYWGAFLGLGGHICDTISWYNDAIESGLDIGPEEITDKAFAFCEEYYNSEWVDCRDILKV